MPYSVITIPNNRSSIIYTIYSITDLLYLTETAQFIYLFPKFRINAIINRHTKMR